MRKNNPKYNDWLKRRLRRLEKKKRRKKHFRGAQGNPTYKSKEKKEVSPNEAYVVSAPSNFSIKDNALEMSDFFDKVVKFTNKKQKAAYIMFDLAKIENVTADAIIYLLAVIKDLQKLGLSHHKFTGNLPINPKAKEYFIQSGFLDYMESKIQKDYTNSQCVQIISNNQYNQLSTKTICDFTTKHCNFTKQSTRFLYVLINEMMLNTYQHAYVKIVQRKIVKEKFKRLKDFNWRLFAELCALSLIPAIYQTVKTFIISSNNQNAVFDIIGQMEWFDLINETLQAFLIIPLYSILNKILKNNSENFANYTFKTGLLTFIIYTLFSVGILIYGVVLIKAMNPDEIDIATTNVYLKLETIAFC